MALPRLAITPGEPAGIGPDITLQVAQQAWDAQLVVIADSALLKARAQQLGADITLVPFDSNQAPRPHRPGELPVIDIRLKETVTAGELNPANGPYVLETLNAALQGSREGYVDALVTGPVQKSVINDAGIPFSGHTEFLAEQTNTARVVMMLATQDLRVALVTTHLPLSAVAAAITPDVLRETLEILHAALVNTFGIDTPRISVLGLNPHAGEGGHLGREEIDFIIPELESLRARGWQLLGPLPADTAFNPTTLAETDAFLAMYHDQGLPVLKFAGFGNAINITLGLPLIRTSVDHGTALSLAGTGAADASSLGHAVRIATGLVKTTS